MKSLFFFVFISVCSVAASAQLDPWYQKKKLKDFEMTVFFDKKSTDIKQYYDFHLRNYLNYMVQRSDGRMVIVHKNNSTLSRTRAYKLRNRMVRKFGMSKGKIELREGTPPKYFVSKGENLVVFLRNKASFVSTPIVRKKIRRPAYVKKQEIVYIERTPQLKINSFDLDLGLRNYSFDNTVEEITALYLNVDLKRRLGSSFYGLLNVGSSISESSLVSGREFHAALGFGNAFDKFNLSTKVYGRRNWSWVQSDSEFVIVNDLGLHQGLEFELVRRPSCLISLGVWGEFSFSNTISSFASTNVLGFQSEIKLEWFKYNSVISLYRLSRKYEQVGATVLGLNLSYKF